MKFRIDGNKILITLSKGDHINNNFEKLANNKKIKFAWINGLGAFENPEIGYYSIKDKCYHRKQFVGEYELTSLTGNITIKDNKPFSHTHITFSDTDYKVFGGHLFDARITAAGEFIMQVGENYVHRKMNYNIGLHLWCLEDPDE